MIGQAPASESCKKNKRKVQQGPQPSATLQLLCHLPPCNTIHLSKLKRFKMKTLTPLVLVCATQDISSSWQTAATMTTMSFWLSSMLHCQPSHLMLTSTSHCQPSHLMLTSPQLLTATTTMRKSALATGKMKMLPKLPKKN